MAQQNCPHCGGTGWRLIEAENAARTAVLCECSAQDRNVRLFESARIPHRYEDRDFANFETDLYAETEPNGTTWDQSLEQAKLTMQAFVRDYPLQVDYGLLLMGPSGVGKTHLAVAALKDLLQRGHSALFSDYNDLLKQILRSYSPESQTTELDLLEPVLRAELLVLDDLGANKPSAWALETVGYILNTRYNEKRATLITTNFLDRDVDRPERFPSGQQAPRLEETLADRIGHRVRSRLYEMCRTVEIIAGDYRQKFLQAGRLRP
jgi:DNA replication protein DnaC